ncbi:MAG: hypothetical protein E7404_07165 [Ruminococcaceae bacterium]|nr:hypothetical protein [Oscillospiraceae bacterium]
MKIIAVILVLLGAFVSYGAKMISEKILKLSDADDKYVNIIKLVGFIIVLIGAILVFKFV